MLTKRNNIFCLLQADKWGIYNFNNTHLHLYIICLNQSTQCFIEMGSFKEVNKLYLVSRRDQKVAENTTGVFSYVWFFWQHGLLNLTYYLIGHHHSAHFNIVLVWSNYVWNGPKYFLLKFYGWFKHLAKKLHHPIIVKYRYKLRNLTPASNISKKINNLFYFFAFDFLSMDMLYHKRNKTNTQ